MATHAASPNSTHTATPSMPQEDIGSVLERFQKWTGGRPEPVRELTYEEAAARSRRRVYADEDTVAPTPGKTVSEAVKAKPSASKSRIAKAAQPGIGKSVAKNTAKPARATNKKPASRKAAAQPSQQPVEAAATSRNTAASAYQTIQKAGGEILPATPAGFQQVLAAHFHTPEAPLAVKSDAKPIAPLSNDAPAVHLTVRFAREERDAVRERAHDLGITPSAYMRHCILEIDSLRAELESARLAYARVSDSAFSPEAPALEGGSRLILNRKNALQNLRSDGAWLTRLIHFMLPGKARGQTLSTNA